MNIYIYFIDLSLKPLLPQLTNYDLEPTVFQRS